MTAVTNLRDLVRLKMHAEIVSCMQRCRWGGAIAGLGMWMDSGGGVQCQLLDS